MRSRKKQDGLPNAYGLRAARIYQRVAASQNSAPAFSLAPSPAQGPADRIRGLEL